MALDLHRQSQTHRLRTIIKKNNEIDPPDLRAGLRRAADQGLPRRVSILFGRHFLRQQKLTYLNSVFFANTKAGKDKEVEIQKKENSVQKKRQYRSNKESSRSASPDRRSRERDGRPNRRRSNSPRQRRNSRNRYRSRSPRRENR